MRIGRGAIGMLGADIVRKGHYPNMEINLSVEHLPPAASKGNNLADKGGR
jgi:hypothetical protein